MVTSSEPISIAEIGSGTYFVFFTPTQASTLYRLPVAVVSLVQIVSESDIQVDVTGAEALTGPTGPYLTTLANVKTAWKLAGADFDATTNALLPQVTSYFETECDRHFFSAAVTEYPNLRSLCTSELFLRRPPATSVASVHASSSTPRVYDDSSALTSDRDYLLSEDGHRIELTAPFTL